MCFCLGEGELEAFFGGTDEALDGCLAGIDGAIDVALAGRVVTPTPGFIVTDGFTAEIVALSIVEPILKCFYKYIKFLKHFISTKENFFNSWKAYR